MPTGETGGRMNGAGQGEKPLVPLSFQLESDEACD